MVKVVLVLLGLYLDNKIKVDKLLGFSSFGHSRKRKKRRRQTRNQKSLSKNKQKPCFYSKENNNNQRNCFRKQRPIYLACEKIRSDTCFKKKTGEHKIYKLMKHKEWSQGGSPKESFKWPTLIFTVNFLGNKLLDKTLSFAS